MKTITFIHTCMIGLTLTASAGMFSLKTIKLPLWYNGEDEKGIQILRVPKIDFDNPGNWNMIKLFDDPFEQFDPRRTTTSGIPHREDLNMIYAYGIKTMAVYGDKRNRDTPLKLVIDISKAEKANSFSIIEVTRAAAVCVRDFLPKTTGVPLVLKDGEKELEFEPPFGAAEYFPLPTGNGWSTRCGSNFESDRV